MKKFKLLLFLVAIMLSFSASAKNIPLWWNVSPSDGSTVEELNVLKIDNGSYSDTFRVEEGASLYINGESVAYTVSYETNYGYTDDTIVITLVEPITSAGEYSIDVPAGFFTYMYYGETLSTSKEFEWSVSVKGDANGDSEEFETSIPSGFSVSPADGATVASLSSLKIADAEDGDYYVTAVYEQGESEPSNIVYVTFGPLPTPAVTDLSAKVENNVLTLTWSAPEGAGTHAVSALLGYYVYRDGIVLNPEGNLIWYDAELKYVVDPAVSGSYTVRALYFDGESEDSNVVVVDLSGISTVTESNNDGDFYTLHGVKVKNPIKGNIYIHNGKKVVF